MPPTVAQPLSAIDVETFMLAALALVLALVWLRDREPGMLWVSLGLVCGALWYLNSERLHFSGPLMSLPAVRYWALVISASIVLESIGVARYLAPLSRWMVVWVALCCAPAIVFMVLLAVGVELPRRVYHIGTLFAYLGPAVVALRRHRDEPRAGHAVLALVMFVFPLIPIVFMVWEIDAGLLRTIAALPVILFGLILLTVSLLRRREALEAEVARRKQAEQSLRAANVDLEQRVAERTAHLAELVAGLEAFSRSVSHDLRGPLGGIASLARMAHERLVEEGSTELAARSLPLIAVQAESAVKLVTTLLELARLGEAGVRRHRMSLAALVQEAVTTVGLGTGSAGVRIVVEALPEIHADPDLLRPALVNLIGNAAKFSRFAVSPEVRVGSRVVGNAIEVIVSDNGIGFAATDSERLFEAFCRVHDGRFEGHGLGLSIVRRAVERHGGRVWATSSAGHGASFTFSIPAAALHEGQPPGGDDGRRSPAAAAS